jgi:hypothetical protein
MKNFLTTVTATTSPPEMQQVSLGRITSGAKSTTGTKSRKKEFTVASMMSRVLRDSLSPGMSEICESYVSGRLTAKFRSLAKFGDGTTGKRPMCISKHGHILSGFEFNTTSPYDKIFGAKYYIKPGSQRGQVILHFPAFIPMQVFKTPKNATNFKINARLVALSDFFFNSEEEKYLPKNKDTHGKFGSFESQMLPLLKIPTEPITTNISVTHRQVPEDTALFLVMAVSFYEYEHGSFHHLPRESGMQIERVY